ncbi:MAG: hypothetical protein DWQ01_22055 [Planctomycetota bacterium]|nr:MAG: hypothetical protein DWQ01_22055 [Planctomycetota bacterium]
MICTSLLVFSPFLFGVPGGFGNTACVDASLSEWALSQQDEAEAVQKEFVSAVKSRDFLKEDDVALKAIALVDRMVQLYQGNAKRLTEINEDLELGEGDSRALKKEGKELEKVQESLAKTVFLAFKYRKRPTERRNLDLWKASAFAFGQMGSHGSVFLWKAFDDKRFNKDVEFRALCVEQVGYTLDYEQAEALLDFLDYKDEEVIAAAGRALSQFEDAPGSIRKECVGKIVKQLESYHNAASELEDNNSKRIYRKVREPLTTALRNLTGESFSDPLDWTRWWNKNKKNRSAWEDRDS